MKYDIEWLKFKIILWLDKEEYIDKIVEDMVFTTEHQKEYKREYYKQHRDRYNQQYLKWCRDNPKKAKAIRDRWRAKNPHYSRDYQRKREAAAEPLIFEFLDNSSAGIEGYIAYLRNRGVPEQHIDWFLKDVEKHIT